MCKCNRNQSMELETLIAECTAYDYKVTLEEKKPKSWLKSVSAFANGSGGSLFFGVDNGGNVQGLDDVQHVCEAISSRIRDSLEWIMAAMFKDLMMCNMFVRPSAVEFAIIWIHFLRWK